MTDKWAEHKQKFCGCKDASRLNRCQGRNNCELPEGHPERVSAAPRQPEGDAISRERVQSEADAFFDWPTADKSSVTTTSCLIFARCIAGMVAAERDATIAELREECEHLKACQENAMLHMTGLVTERNTLRQQLSEMTKDRDDCLSARKHYVEKLGDALAQNYTLAGLLAKAQEELDPHRHAVLWGEICAALAEVNK